MKNKYPVIIFLNQKYVFDLLAVIENGISYIETIKSTGHDSKNSIKNTNGEVGASNIFALIGIKLSGSFKRENSNSQVEETTKEKIHTPNSLFAKLREALYEEKLIKSIDECETGDFVEVKCKLSQNPLISIFQKLFSTLELAAIFQEAQKTQYTINDKRKQINQTQKPKHEFAKTLVDKFKTLVDQIESGETIDMMGNLIENNKKLVISLDKQYLNDPTLADLKDAELSILGKVTKILNEEDKDKINLLRKTKFSAISSKMLEGLIGAFSEMENEGFQVPEIETEIKGPAIQILPIGIFT